MQTDKSVNDVLQRMLEIFRAREWSQFHSPKNISMALASEVGELLDPFRFLTEEESSRLDPKMLEKVKDEIGDVFIFTIYLAHLLGIDPIEASLSKLDKNEKKYPVDRFRANKAKYNEDLENTSIT